MYTKRKTYGQPIEILKFNEYKGAPCMVSDSGVAADENGLKIVKAGTPIDTDGVAVTDAVSQTVLGLLLHDTDVTEGPQPGTYVYAGAIDNKALTKNGIEISAGVKEALPRVTFFD